MSLHIYIAHSGEHLLADPVAFASYVDSSPHEGAFYWVSCLRMSSVCKLTLF
jgi:hypothetical protein